MNRLCLLFLLITWPLLAIETTWADEYETPLEMHDVRSSKWQGFDRIDFIFDERECILVSPKVVAQKRPWIWRARFFGHEPQTDIELLYRGFHLAYIDVSNLFGSPKAVQHWDKFYQLMTIEHGFAKQTVLEGMSRGGLIVYNWAKLNPNKVACIYADAPVCDIRSWPSGFGKSKGNQQAWKQCLKAYGMSKAEAVDYAGGPLEGLEALAAARVPLLHVCGTDDKVVPVRENTDLLEATYRNLRGPIQVVRKSGVGHHPHSLKDPQRIVDFIITHTIASQSFH